jgi:hypothetical protein
MDQFVKITAGFVCQTYEKDKSGKFVCVFQEFIAGDMVDYEDRQGNALKEVPEHESQPFTMYIKKVKGK